MEQMELMFVPQFWFDYCSNPGHAKKWRHQSVSVTDAEGFALIHVMAETYRTHPKKRDMIDLAKRALREYHTRPYGDEYSHPDGEVAYLTELQK